MKNKNRYYSIVIIGLGCLGASIFRSLKLRGVKNILILDKNERGGGISFQSGGMIRVFHKNRTDQIAARYGQSIFYHLKKEIGLNILQTGSLSIMPKQYATKLNTGKFDFFNSQELSKKFPKLSFYKNEVGIYEKNGASINVKEYIEKIIHFYRDDRDDIFENTCVHKIYSGPNGKHEIITDSSLFLASHIVVTSGLGLRKILPEIYQGQGFEKRKITTYNVTVKQIQHLPNFFDYSKIFYGTRGFQGREGTFRVGLRSGARNSKDEVRKYAKKRFRFDYKISEENRSANDLYLKNRDGFLGEISGRSGLYVLAGWGGGGFKFSPFLGDKMAQKIKKL